MLLFAGILNLFSSYLIASIVRNFLAIYVAFFGFVVLNIEILSLFKGIYDVNIIIFSIINLIFSFVLFKYKKAEFLKFKIDYRKIKNSLILDKSLIFLLFSFFILIIVSGILAYIMPPLEPDSQTYHFLRAYMFYKNHSLSHFETNDVRALIMPFNSEIVYTWILTLKHKLYNYALLSYFSYFAVICAIWQILGIMKFSIRKKMFTIFVFSSLASTVVEMSCLQTDIVVGALVVCALALFLKKNNFLSSVAFSIALGVKTTAFIMLVPFLIIIFLLNKKEFLKYLGYLFFNFIIFSSYNYVLNFIQFSNPITNYSGYVGHKFWGGFEGYISNLIHFSFQFFDFTGFSWGYYLNNKIFALKDIVFHILSINPEIGNNVAQKQINITTDEQIIGFGILGFLGIIPAVIKGLFSKQKILHFLSLALIVNIIILAGFMAYMEYSIRFILAFVCFSAPVFVLIYYKKGLYKNLICLFCIFYMAIIPIHIRRAPFFKIFPYLIENHFNLDKFVNDCFEGKIIPIWTLTPEIKNIVLKKYPTSKKIGYFKTTMSSALYLKTFRDIDFLTTANIDKYDLTKYDLLIFEGETQDDNIFKNVEINYEIKEEQIVIDYRKTSCFYLDMYDKPAKNNQTATKRWCFFANKMMNKPFKPDYKFEYKFLNIDKTEENKNIYFYTKLN